MFGDGFIPAHAGKIGLDSLDELHRWAHPRSRGENATACPISVENRGSSPLTRGKSAERVLRGIRHGLIPAHAGKIRRDRARPHGDGAHPRSRGENTAAASASVSSWGSSPLTRGKSHGRGGSACEPGLIPAHAGKIPSRLPRLSLAGAHPRSRGENCTPGTRVPVTQGSSPLTRGKSERR